MSGAKRRPRGVKRVLKWVGIAALGWILLSFLAFAVSAQLQAFKLSGEAKDALHGNPFLLPSAQTILVLGTDARPPDTKEPGPAAPRRPSQKCFEQQAHGDAPHDRLRRRPVPRRHADADPGRRRHLPQTLDPARQLRRNPRPEPAENQRRLRLRRRRAADQDGRKVPRHPDRPRRDRRLHRLRRPDQRGRRGQVNLPHKLCAEIAGGAGGGQGGYTLRLGKGENTLDGEQALVYSRIREPSECPGPGQERLHLRLQRLQPRRRPSRR